TFDVTIMEVFEGTLEIRSTAGESQLGGEDFTDRLVAAVLKTENKQLETAELREPLRVTRLRSECELAKRKLATESVARVRVPDVEGKVGDAAKRFKIDEPTFAKICVPLMRRIAYPVSKAIRDADIEASEVDDVILVGGSTRLSMLRRFAEEYFQKTPSMQFNPDEVVALGAAIQAALIEQDKAVDDMVMTDVCPFTMGIEVVKEFGSQMRDGYFQPVIHRNTTIPISREETFATVQHHQAEVDLRVFQGDSRKVEQNVELGKLSIKLPPRPKGSPIQVRFTYDLNGILEVEAYSPEGGEKFRAVFTNHVRGLNQKEIDAAINRLSELKFYPREDLRNQHLATYAERMLGEVSSQRRDELDQAIDVYEHAMASSDKQMFDDAKQVLLIVLSGLGVPYDPSGVGDDLFDGPTEAGDEHG
ncbi:MAG: Hsp70 family protein, partial [Planctomycetota bacterium]